MITFQPSMCHTTFYMLLKQNKKKKGSIEGTRDFAIIVVWWSSESSAGGRKERSSKSLTENRVSVAVRKTRDPSSEPLDTKRTPDQRENKERCTRAELRLAIFFSLRLIKKTECSLYDEAPKAARYVPSSRCFEFSKNVARKETSMRERAVLRRFILYHWSTMIDRK